MTWLSINFKRCSNADFPHAGQLDHWEKENALLFPSSESYPFFILQLGMAGKDSQLPGGFHFLFNQQVP